MNSIEKHFINQHNVQINEELMAFSSLLQWIYRSAVRVGKPVWIYMISRKMHFTDEMAD